MLGLGGTIGSSDPQNTMQRQQWRINALEQRIAALEAALVEERARIIAHTDVYFGDPRVQARAELVEEGLLEDKPL
jgi:hypothetical protein